MDFNKISEYTILHIVTALAILITASVVRYVCVQSGCDTGAAGKYITADEIKKTE